MPALDAVLPTTKPTPHHPLVILSAAKNHSAVVLSKGRSKHRLTFVILNEVKNHSAVVLGMGHKHPPAFVILNEVKNLAPMEFTPPSVVAPTNKPPPYT